VTHEINTGRTSDENHSCSAATNRHGYMMSFARGYDCAVTFFGWDRTWILIIISYDNHEFWNIKKIVILNVCYLPIDIHWYMKIINVYVGLQLGPEHITTKHGDSPCINMCEWKHVILIWFCNSI
jgi:hypothetical protein